jgi:hypothetical protein
VAIENPNAMALKAKEIAAEFGAEAVIIISLHPTADGDGWLAHHAAYMETGCGLDWGTVSQVVRDAGTEMDAEPAIDMPPPS